jgi:putative addiction module component (TIGR02574 family)
MPSALAKVKTEVRRLNSRDRAELARFLLDSLEPEKVDSVARAWKKEIARRVKDIREGRAIGRPAEQVFADLRERRR